MKRTRMVGVALLALLALGALSIAGNASATMWLKSGEAITKREAKKNKWKIDLSVSGGTLGSGKVECTGETEGTAGPGAQDEETLVLKGTELDLIKCTTLSGFCGSPVLHPEKLPWTTLLELINGVTWDALSSTMAFEMLCVIGKLLCGNAVLKAKFVKNVASGAELAFEGASSGTATCNDGGTAVMEGSVLAEGFTIS